MGYQRLNRRDRRNLIRLINQTCGVACASCRAPVASHRDVVYNHETTAVAHARCFDVESR